jgi:hypothetical protein
LRSSNVLATPHPGLWTTSKQCSIDSRRIRGNINLHQVITDDGQNFSATTVAGANLELISPSKSAFGLSKHGTFVFSTVRVISARPGVLDAYFKLSSRLKLLGGVPAISLSWALAWLQGPINRVFGDNFARRNLSSSLQLYLSALIPTNLKNVPIPNSTICRMARSTLCYSAESFSP